jgi:transglutaminase-like putative cysteine protease
LIRAIFWYVKRKIRFRLDEDIVYNELGEQDWNQELLIDPGLMLSMPNPEGDCDDFSLLCASMLCAAHIKCTYVTIAADPEMPQRFSHIYVAAYVKSCRVPMDCSHGNLLGWETGKVYRKVEWDVN